MLDIRFQGDIVIGAGLVGIRERHIVVQLQPDGVTQHFQAPLGGALVQYLCREEVAAQSLVGQFVGLLVEAPSHLHRYGGTGVLADVHQCTQAQVGHDQPPGKQGHQGVVLPVHMGAHPECRTRARGVVQIHHRLGVMQAQYFQDLLRQRALGIVERRPETTVEVPRPGQHTVTEQRRRQRRRHRGDDTDHIDRRVLAGLQPAVQGHGAGRFIAVQQGHQRAGAATVLPGEEQAGGAVQPAQE